MVAIQTVNGTAPVIEPDAFNITKSDLYSDSTGRSAETGVLLSYPIRLNIYKIELEYSGSAAQIKAIEQLFSGASLNVTFNDYGEYITKKMYPSDRLRGAKTMKGSQRYTLSFSLTEF